MSSELPVDLGGKGIAVSSPGTYLVPETDKRDAKWTADIFKHDLVAESFIPPADIRQLRDLVRYRWKSPASLGRLVLCALLGNGA